MPRPEGACPPHRRRRPAPATGRGLVRARADGGYVTAEAAVVVPTLVLLAVLLLWGLMAAATKIQCVDGARAGARAAARGETAQGVESAVRSVTPDGAAVATVRERELVRVRVQVRTPGPGALSLALRAEAVALAEQGTGVGAGVEGS